MSKQRQNNTLQQEGKVNNIAKNVKGQSRLPDDFFIGSASIQTQVPILYDSRLQATQRQMIADQIGRFAGNQVLHRLIAQEQKNRNEVQRKPNPNIVTIQPINAGVTDLGIIQLTQTFTGSQFDNTPYNLSHFKNYIDSIKNDVKKAIGIETQIEGQNLAPIRNYMKQVETAINESNWEEAKKYCDLLADLVTNSLEVGETLDAIAAEQANHAEAEKQAKWLGPMRAAKISEEILGSKHFFLFRKMSEAEAQKIEAKFNETKGNKQKQALSVVTADNNSRKWLSTTSGHSEKFSNENVDEGTKQVTLRFTLDSKTYHQILAFRFPAYQTDSYKPGNKSRALIHQENLAQGTIANTKNDSELEKIFTEREHYNVGFSEIQINQVDNAIVAIDRL